MHIRWTLQRSSEKSIISAHTITASEPLWSWDSHSALLCSYHRSRSVYDMLHSSFCPLTLISLLSSLLHHTVFLSVHGWSSGCCCVMSIVDSLWAGARMEREKNEIYVYSIQQRRMNNNGRRREEKKRWKIHSLIFRYFSVQLLAAAPEKTPRILFDFPPSPVSLTQSLCVDVGPELKSENIRGKGELYSNFSKAASCRCWTWSNKVEKQKSKRRRKKAAENSSCVHIILPPVHSRFIFFSPSAQNSTESGWVQLSLYNKHKKCMHFFLLALCNESQVEFTSVQFHKCSSEMKIEGKTGERDVEGEDKRVQSTEDVKMCRNMS